MVLLLHGFTSGVSHGPSSCHDRAGRAALIYQLWVSFIFLSPLFSLTSHFRSNTLCYLSVTLLVTALVYDLLGNGITRGILSALDVIRC